MDIASRRVPSPLRSVETSEHGGQRRKVHPSLALRHGLRIKLLRLRAASAGLLFLDQADKCLRSLRTHAPHRGYRLRATAERLFRRQCIFVRNQCRCRARPAEEIAERACIKALEPVGSLLLKRAQRPDVFLDRGANGLGEAASTSAGIGTASIMIPARDFIMIPRHAEGANDTSAATVPVAGLRCASPSESRGRARARLQSK
jgi:hypothetical protein